LKSKDIENIKRNFITKHDEDCYVELKDLKPILRYNKIISPEDAILFYLASLYHGRYVKNLFSKTSTPEEINNFISKTKGNFSWGKMKILPSKIRENSRNLVCIPTVYYEIFPREAICFANEEGELKIVPKYSKKTDDYKKMKQISFSFHPYLLKTFSKEERKYMKKDKYGWVIFPRELIE